MKSIYIPVIFLSFASVVSGATWEETYDALLQKYATKEGVRYAAWHSDRADRAALDVVADGVAKASLSGKNRDEQLAFYLNAYNIWILKTMLDNYPTKSIKDIRLFVFRRNSLRVAGKKTSFTKLENDIIRKRFKESRIHFALNCASASCPPLHNRAFTAETLDATLTELAKEFITDNPLGLWSRNQGAEVHASKIFDWYEDDFKAESGSILAYLGKYRGKPYPKGAKLIFQDYDWSINEAKR